MANFVLTDPLDRSLVRAFNRAVTTAYAMNDLADDPSRELDIKEAHRELNRLGLSLLGSHELFDEVMNILGDGPAEGDVLGALFLLWRLKELTCSAEVFAQLEDRVKGGYSPLPHPVWTQRNS